MLFQQLANYGTSYYMYANILFWNVAMTSE